MEVEAMCDKLESIKIRNEAFSMCKKVLNDKLVDCYLYGSYARGDYHKYSDVDIMMVVDMSYEELNSTRYDISHIGSSLSLKYDVTVSIKLQPKEILEKYKDVVPFYKNVLSEGLRYES